MLKACLCSVYNASDAFNFIHIHVGFYLQQCPAYTFEETLEFYFVKY